MFLAIGTGISVAAVLAQGLLSFFSPCVLPLVPLYMSYLAGGMGETDKDGRVVYPRKKIIINTLFFVLGVSFAFFALGLGVTALGSLVSGSGEIIVRVGGALLVLFGLYQIGLFGHVKALDGEHRLPLKLNKFAMGPIPALIMGFAFSFAWTPCVGPALSSELVMAGTSGTAAKGFLLIGIYTLGFVVPFLAVGLFTGALLGFFKKHANVVKYTAKIGAAIMIIIGVLMLFGVMGGSTVPETPGEQPSQTAIDDDKTPDAQDPGNTPSGGGDSIEEHTGETRQPAVDYAPDFTLTALDGRQYTLSSLRGKKVFINFWATWCGYCVQELPEVQKLYEQMGENSGDVIVITVVGPGYGREQSASELIEYCRDNGYTFPSLADSAGSLYGTYRVSGLPTTVVIGTDGALAARRIGAMTLSDMKAMLDTAK